MQTRRHILTLAAALSLAATAAAAPNGDRPLEPGPARLQLEELWRVGGLDDDENLFGVIDGVTADADGNLYLLDVQLTEVQVFSPDGEHLRNLGQEGDGPGEMRRPSEVLLLPDGSVGVVQAFPGRIIKLTLDGLPAGELRPGGDDPTAGGMFALRAAQVVGGELVCSGARMARGETTRKAVHFLASFDLGGAEKVRYLELTTEREMGRSQVREDEEFFPHAGGWTALADGRVVVAPERNGYRLEVRTPDGQVQAELTRPYRAWQRTEEEKAEVSSMMGRFGPRNRPRPDFVVLPTEKDILRVRDGGDGTVWVLPSRGVREQPAGVHSTWDVFATDGRWLRQVSVVCEGDGRNDALFFTGDGRAVLVREHAGAMRAFRGAATGEDEADAGEAQPLEIVVYRIVH